MLSGTAENLTVARSLLAISAVQLLVLAVAALLAIARLLAAQRASETELLTARGATRWQLTRLTATEVIPLCCVAALVGAFAGIRLAQVLAGTLYRGGTGTGGISAAAAGTWLDALGATVAVAVIASAVLLYPVLRPAPAPAPARGRRPGPARQAGGARQRHPRGRGSRPDRARRAGRLAAAPLLGRLAGRGGGTPSIDPVLVLAPALALAGGTVVMLRLLPAAARGGDRLAARGRKLTAPLASWQFSRQPLRQGGAALLLVMAVATGTLALAQHRSWTQWPTTRRPRRPAPTCGQTCQARWRQGRSARSPRPRVCSTRWPPTSRRRHCPRRCWPSTPLRRRGPSCSAATSRRCPRAAVRDHRTRGPGRPHKLSGRPDSVRLTASLNAQGRAGTVTGLGAVTVLVTIADYTRRRVPDPAGHAAGRRSPARAHRPARRDQGQLSAAADAGVLRLHPGRGPGRRDAAHAEGQRRPAGRLDRGRRLAGTRPGDGRRRPGYGRACRGPRHRYLAPLGRRRHARLHSRLRPGRARRQRTAGDGAATVDRQVTLTAGGMAPAAIPAIATTAFLRANNTAVGATLPATINGVTVPVRIAAETTTFPTVAGGALIVDLRTLQGALASHGGYPLPVTEWWLATADGAVPPGLARALPPGSAVSSTAALATTVTGDPLAAAPQQALLALAIAAALLAITGFWVSIAADVRQRRAENALLAALGVGRRSAAAQLFLEKLLLSVPSAVLGLVLGLAVARLLVPAVTLTTSARQPVPPPVTLFDLPQTLLLAAVVAIVPALAAALVVVRRPDPAAELRAAEAT